MKTRIMIQTLLGALVLLTLTTGVALAWPDQPPDKAIISGPGIKGDVAITDKQTLEALQLGAIEDFNQGAIAKPNLNGEGYQITRYFYGGTFNFATLHYYPAPSGGRGYVFFEDGPDLSGDPTAYNGQWFYATSEGEAAMQRLLTQLGVRSQPEAAATAIAPPVVAPPVVAPPVAATAPARAPLPAMLLAALAGSLVIIWLARWNVKQPIPSETPAK